MNEREPPAAFPGVSVLLRRFVRVFRGMSIDVVDLRIFYGQRLGVVARRFIGRGIRSLWGNTASPH